MNRQRWARVSFPSLHRKVILRSKVPASTAMPFSCRSFSTSTLLKYRIFIVKQWICRSIWKLIYKLWVKRQVAVYTFVKSNLLAKDGYFTPSVHSSRQKNFLGFVHPQTIGQPVVSYVRINSHLIFRIRQPFGTENRSRYDCCKWLWFMVIRSFNRWSTVNWTQNSPNHK